MDQDDFGSAQQDSQEWGLPEEQMQDYLLPVK